MFFSGMTIGINGFSIVFYFATIVFDGFRWFLTIGQTVRWLRYDAVSVCVLDLVPKSDESESGQIVSEKVK